MKPFAVLSFVLCFIICSSCTTPSPEAVDLVLEYQEKIVISGLLSAGDTIQNIHFSKTFPATQNPDEDKTAIPDAQVQIIVDNRTYTMELQPEIPDTRFVPPRVDKRSFFRVPGLIAQAGKTYKIVVRWKGLSAEAITTIPALPPVIDSYRFAVELDGVLGGQAASVYASFKARPNECYQMVAQMKWKYPPNPFGPPTFPSALSDIVRQENADANNIISLKIPRLQIGINDVEKFDSLYTGDIIFYTYNMAYFDYQRSIVQRTNDLVFNVPTNNPKWNVRGDGIGLFVGLSTSRTPLKQKGK